MFAHIDPTTRLRFDDGALPFVTGVELLELCVLIIESKI